MTHTVGVTSTSRNWWLAVGAGMVLAALMFGRVLGPLDTWDQSQPRTMSYTTDIVINGHWVLPSWNQLQPATKPPLYNWIAAPGVALLGFESEIGHKLPSLLALGACFVVLVRFGSSLEKGDAVGWVAAIAFISNYGIFKLGFLARPDMLLVIWLLQGWIAGTACLLEAHQVRRRRFLALAFWLCVVCAGLTKGPPALLLPVYALVAARLLTGRFSHFNRLEPWWGVPLVVVGIGWWITAVAFENREHLIEELWFNEIAGRVSGKGPEGGSAGWWGIVRDAPLMPVYFVIRFLPWSIVFLIGSLALVKREQGRVRVWKSLANGNWLFGGVLWVVIVIAFFTLSSGKRADYIAPALGPGALVCGWWMVARCKRWVVAAAPVAGLAIIVMCGIGHNAQVAALAPGHSENARSIVREISKRLNAAPLPVVAFNLGPNDLQALIGTSAADEWWAAWDAVIAMIDTGEPFYVVAAGWDDRQRTFDWGMGRLRSVDGRAEAERLYQSPVLDDPHDRHHWPEVVELFLVTPNGR